MQFNFYLFARNPQIQIRITLKYFMLNFSIYLVYEKKITRQIEYFFKLLAN